MVLYIVKVRNSALFSGFFDGIRLFYPPGPGKTVISGTFVNI